MLSISMAVAVSTWPRTASLSIIPATSAPAPTRSSTASGQSQASCAFMRSKPRCQLPRQHRPRRPLQRQRPLQRHARQLRTAPVQRYGDASLLTETAAADIPNRASADLIVGRKRRRGALLRLRCAARGWPRPRDRGLVCRVVVGVHRLDSCIANARQARGQRNRAQRRVPRWSVSHPRRYAPAATLLVCHKAAPHVPCLSTNPIQSPINPIQSNSITNPIQSNPIESNRIQSNPINLSRAFSARRRRESNGGFN